jgi:hypothetical protein
MHAAQGMLLTALHRAGLPPMLVATAAVLIPSIHLFGDLRATYGLSTGGAGWRLLGLLPCIAIIIALFVQILWLIGMAG